MDNVRCEGATAYLGKLIELNAEGEEHYRDLENKTEYEIDDSGNESSDYKPKKVSDRICAEVNVASLADGLHVELRNLEALLAEGNTDYSNAPYDSCKEPKCRADASEGEEP